MFSQNSAAWLRAGKWSALGLCFSPPRLYFRPPTPRVGGLVWAASAKAPAEPPESVIAIGDVHNDYDDFVAIPAHRTYRQAEPLDGRQDNICPGRGFYLIAARSHARSWT